MKKFLSVICACALMAGFTACGNSEAGTQTSTENKPESSAAESSADETPATEESEEETTEEVSEETIGDSKETAEDSEEETEENADEISEGDRVEESNILASSIMKAANTALVDLDVSGTDTKSFDGYQCCTFDNESKTIDEKLLDAMKYYFDIYNNEFAVYIENGVCVAAVAIVDGYCGSYPVISENESEYDDTLDLVSALELAVSSVDEEQR